MANELKSLFPVNLQYFADEPPVDTPEEPAVTDNPEAPQEPQKTFTQAEIDEILAKRLERERKKYADYEDLKKKAEEFEKLAEEKRLAEMTAQQRAEEEARKAQEERDRLFRELEEERAKIRREKIESEFIRLAASANIAYVDDALRLVDISAVEIGEDGKPVGVDTIVKQLVQDKPFLLSQKAQQKPVGTLTNPPDQGSVDLGKLSPIQLMRVGYGSK